MGHSVREHLKTMGTHHAEFHITMAKLHKTAADAAEKDSPEAKFHKGATDCHADAAENHIALCKEIDAAPSYKTAGMSGEVERLVPDRYTSVIPSDVPAFTKAVIRPGQPEINVEAVPEAFRHLCEFPDEV